MRHKLVPATILFSAAVIAGLMIAPFAETGMVNLTPAGQNLNATPAVYQPDTDDPEQLSEDIDSVEDAAEASESESASTSASSNVSAANSASSNAGADSGEVSTGYASNDSSGGTIHYPATVTSGPAPVANDDRNAVAEWYQKDYAATSKLSMTWSGTKPSGCQPGTPSNAVLSGHLAQINLYRKLAGLSPVTNNKSLNTDAQWAALVFAKAQQISHNPPSSWPCMSNSGGKASKGASSSNIGLGKTMDSSIYIKDDGVSVLGHRRWLLLPNLGQIGLGVYSSGSGYGATTQRVIHNNRAKNYKNPASASWPTAGWFPKQLLGKIWSWQPKQGVKVSFSGAKVTMKNSKGKAISVNQYTTQSGYGMDTLAWTPSGISTSKIKGSTYETYTVTISNLTYNGKKTTVSYQVKLMDPSYKAPVPKPSTTPKPTATSKPTASSKPKPSTTPKPTSKPTKTSKPSPKPDTGESSKPAISGVVAVGQTLTVKDGSWKKSGKTYKYQWYREVAVSLKAISGATKSTYKPTAEDRAVRLRVRIQEVDSDGSSTTLWTDYTEKVGKAQSVVRQFAT